MTESGFESKSLSLHNLGTYNYDAKLTIIIIIIIKLSPLAPRTVKSNGRERNLNKIFLYRELNNTLRRHVQGTMRRWSD